MRHEFIKYEFDAGPDDIIEVSLSSQANVRVMDSSNFSSFRSGRGRRRVGRLAKRSLVRLAGPHAGRWHVVVDLGGYAGSVRDSTIFDLIADLADPVARAVPSALTSAAKGNLRMIRPKSSRRRDSPFGVGREKTVR